MEQWEYVPFYEVGVKMDPAFDGLTHILFRNMVNVTCTHTM
jgi:hypothetical protein